MKRVLVLCMVCMFLVSAVASAEVKKGKDSFTGGMNVHCEMKSPYSDSMKFSKNITGKQAIYKIKIIKSNLKKYLIADIPIELKIDQYPVCELKDYIYQVTGPDSYGVSYSSIMESKISLDIIEKIKVSNRIAIRFRDNDATKYPYVLPDDVLAEWKEVINTEA